MDYTDRNGTTLNVGDWVLYPWWGGKEYNYHVGQIKGFSDHYDGVIIVSETELSGSHVLIKLPDDQKERESVAFLFMMENIGVSDLNDF